MLRRVPDQGPAEESRYRLFCRDMTRQLAILAGLVILFCTVAWWPLDPVVFSSQEAVDTFFRLRVRAIAVEVVSLGLFLFIRPSPRATTVAAVACYACLQAAFGRTLGELQPTQLALLADAFVGTVPIAFIPMAVAARVVATVFVGSALGVAFFTANPENLLAAGAPVQLSFLVFAVFFSILIGTVSTRATRRMFFERRALDRANARFAELNSVLGERVAERTEQLRALARHLGALQESERRRLAADLHDDLGQQLTAMRYTVARLENRQMADEDHALIADLGALLEGTGRAVRDVVSRLRPRILDELGLQASLEWLCDDVAERTQTPIDFVWSAPDGDALSIPEEVALTLFRVVQEGVTNALRHAAPSEIAVTVALADDALRVAVRDDGVGFDPEADTAGFGLLGLRERLRGVGGRLRVESASPGTIVTAIVPPRGVALDHETESRP